MTPLQLNRLRKVAEGGHINTTYRLPVGEALETFRKDLLQLVTEAEPKPDVRTQIPEVRCPSTKSIDGGSCSERVPCDGIRKAEGFVVGGCGEPCSFVMDRT